MKRWIVLGLPLLVALLTIGNPVQSWADDVTDNNSNSADDTSLAVKDTLNGNDVADNNSAIVEDNLNGPIGNDVQKAEQAANDNSLAVGDISDIANDDHSIKLKDIDVAVATSVLKGAVAFNSIPMGLGLDIEIETGNNALASKGGTFTVNGISAVSMNTGLQSLTQQSVNVQANLTQ